MPDIKHGEYRTDITLPIIVSALEDSRHDFDRTEQDQTAEATAARARDLGAKGLVQLAKDYIEDLIDADVDGNYSNSGIDLTALEETVKEILGD